MIIFRRLAKRDPSSLRRLLCGERRPAGGRDGVTGGQARAAPSPGETYRQVARAGRRARGQPDATQRRRTHLASRVRTVGHANELTRE